MGVRVLLRCSGLVITLLGAVSAPSAAQEGEAPPPGGSFGRDVYLEDITYTLRLASFSTITVSRHNPNIIYAGSYEGYVWKSIDGGRTWDESRIIVEPHPFYGDSGQRLHFGMIRMAMSPDSNADVDTEKRLGRPLSPAQQAANELRQSGGGGGGGGGGGLAMNIGVGLSGGAPRLQALARQFGMRPLSMNMKMFLGMRGTRATEIRSIIIHPTKPKIVFACTMDGLYKSDDGGLTWVRTFSSTYPQVFHLAIDPADEKRVFLATANGLNISQDGGNNFTPTTANGVAGGTINWIYFNPYDPKFVFAGTNGGLVRSPDGGQNWEWIYYTTLPEGNVIRSIHIDPFDHKTGYVATHDGLLITSDILTGYDETFHPLGGLQFLGVESYKLYPCPKHKGHLWAATNLKVDARGGVGKVDAGGSFVWESLNGGKTWKVIFSGNTAGTMQWFDNDPRDPDLLYLVWARSLSRMKRRLPQARQARSYQVPDDPPLTDVMFAAMRYFGVEPTMQLNHRKRVNYKAFIPQVEAQYLYYHWKDYMMLEDGIYKSALPFRRKESWDTPQNEFRLLFNWDLAPLVFDMEEILFGRVDRVNGEIRSFVNHEVQRFYGELQRLRALMLNSPPRSIRTRVFYRLRIEELTGYLNFITGNYLNRWWEGGRPSGYDTQWWEPWALQHRHAADGSLEDEGEGEDAQ